MLKLSRNTIWAYGLTTLVVASVLVSLSPLIILNITHGEDEFTPESRSTISILSPFRDYALLAAPAQTDNRPHKGKYSESHATRVPLAENKKVPYLSLPGQSPCGRSLLLLTCFAGIDTTSSSWLRYACPLLDLPPPPAGFTEAISI